MTGKQTFVITHTRFINKYCNQYNQMRTWHFWQFKYCTQNSGKTVDILSTHKEVCERKVYFNRPLLPLCGVDYMCLREPCEHDSGKNMTHGGDKPGAVERPCFKDATRALIAAIHEQNTRNCTTYLTDLDYTKPTAMTVVVLPP